MFCLCNAAAQASQLAEIASIEKWYLGADVQYHLTHRAVGAPLMDFIH